MTISSNKNLSSVQWIQTLFSRFSPFYICNSHSWNVHKARIVFSGKVYSLNPFSGGEREPLGVCSLRYEKQFWERNSLISILLIWYFVVWWCCYKIKYGVEEVRLKKNRSDGHSDLIEHMKAIWTRSSEVKIKWAFTKYTLPKSTSQACSRDIL